MSTPIPRKQGLVNRLKGADYTGHGVDYTRAAYVVIRKSVYRWLLTAGRILRKDGVIVRMDGEASRINGYQVKILKAYLYCLSHGLPCRILALKPRQRGSTTICTAIVYHHIRRTKTNAVIIGDRSVTTSNMADMIYRYAENDDFPAWPNRIAKGQRTVYCWDAEGEIFSKINQLTAEAPRASRSATLQVIHASEVAHWPHVGAKSGSDTMLSLLGSLSDLPETLAIAETTANGASGWFYEQWMGNPATGLLPAVTLDELKKGKVGNGWIKVFSPWFAFDDCQIEASVGQQRDIDVTLTERERMGIDRYGWTPHQILWRRVTIQQKCGGSEARFDQEFPEDETRAFLTSGRPRFSARAITRLKQTCGAVAPRCGFLHIQESGKEVAWEDHEEGWAMIYEPPKEDCRYLVWADTMTGREQISESKDPDRHSVLVLRQGYADDNGRTANHAVVARIKSPCIDDYHVLADKVTALSIHYGRAVVGVEVPMGLALIEHLKQRDVPLFHRRPLGPNDSTDERPGFQTTSATKPAIISRLAQSLDEDPPAIDIYDPTLIDEIQTFVVDKHGRECALPGRHDDDVMCLAMALYNIKSASVYKPSKRRSRVPADFHRWKPVHGRR